MPCPIKLNNLLLNLSKTVTLGPEEGGRCREVETRVNVWKLQGEWVQALISLIHGTVWLDIVYPTDPRNPCAEGFYPFFL